VLLLLVKEAGVLRLGACHALPAEPLLVPWALLLLTPAAQVLLLLLLLLLALLLQVVVLPSPPATPPHVLPLQLLRVARRAVTPAPQTPPSQVLAAGQVQPALYNEQTLAAYPRHHC
jgi:hypothetical protein